MARPCPSETIKQPNKYTNKNNIINNNVLKIQESINKENGEALPDLCPGASEAEPYSFTGCPGLSCDSYKDSPRPFVPAFSF